jgi:hypothetical protein
VVGLSPAPLRAAVLTWLQLPKQAQESWPPKRWQAGQAIATKVGDEADSLGLQYLWLNDAWK